MLKKVHLRLTLLCTAITGGIVLAMAAFYLWVSESSQKENNFAAFRNEMQSIVSSLEDQNIITEYYLSSLEAGGRYYVFLEDNGSPLLFGNIIESEEREKRQSLLEEIKAYLDMHLITESAPDSQTQTVYKPYHSELVYETSTGPEEKNRYYVCAAVFPRQQGRLAVYILAPTTQFYRRLFRQRLIFACAGLAALAFLYLFFYFFTRALLNPIRENQEKQSRFIASASHELRTPLSVILSSASLIPESPDKEKDRLCANILQEGSVMKRLLNEMLLLAGSDSHTLTISKTENEPDTLVLDCVETFEPLAKEKKLHLTASLPEEAIPPCPFDRERMEQVLAVLLHNAISYTPEGGHITVSARPLPKGRVQIEVADTGCGVSDEDKKRIFERFYQVDAAHNKKDHFGLGLSIAKEIVREHKGSLTVTDTPGGGATFIIKI